MSKPSFRDQPVPRKCSSSSKHPDFSPYCRHIGVKFNGHVITKDCVGYNVDEGYVLIIKRDVLGNPVKKDKETYEILKMPGTIEPYWR